MDAHYREGAAAVAAMSQRQTSPGIWDGERRRWREGDYVMFAHDGEFCSGTIMSVARGAEQDEYIIRRHVLGGGTEMVSVLDRAMLVY